VPFYFINLLPTSLLYISILLTRAFGWRSMEQEHEADQKQQSRCCCKVVIARPLRPAMPAIMGAGMDIDARYEGNARDDEDEDEDEDEGDDVKKGQTLLMRASALNLTGPPGDRGALQCHWRATQPIGLVPFQARGILPVVEEQSRKPAHVDLEHLEHHAVLDAQQEEEVPAQARAC
jgi:hypothetical protein